jgi:hypothetical protein
MRERAFQVLAGALLLAVLLRSAPPPALADEPRTVRARAIELVDEGGQVRASLQVEAGGEAVFRMRDATGAIRVKLGASEDGSGLLLLDDRTEPAVHLLAKRAGTSVTLAERDKEKRILRP